VLKKIMGLKGSDLKLFVDTLSVAFSAGQLDAIVKTTTDHNREFYVLNPANTPDLVLKIVAIADRQGWLAKFLDEAINANPDPGVAALKDRLAESPIVSAAGPSGDPFETVLINKSLPVVNRKDLRDYLRELAGDIDNSENSRILVISGQPGSGKTYSKTLIQYISLTRGFKNVPLNMDEAQLLPHLTGAPPISASEESLVTPFRLAYLLVSSYKPLRDAFMQENLNGIMKSSAGSDWVKRCAIWLNGELSDSDTLDKWAGKPDRPIWFVLDNFNQTALTGDAYDLVLRLAKIVCKNERLRLVLIALPDETQATLTRDQDVIPGPKIEKIDLVNRSQVQVFFERLFQQIHLPATPAPEAADAAADRVWGGLNPGAPDWMLGLNEQTLAEVNRALTPAAGGGV
jgi:hypothetical protein